MFFILLKALGCINYLKGICVQSYINYFDISLDLIKKGGIILVDNVFWHGDVYDKNKNDKQTNIIREFNLHVKNDKRVEKFILPLGDGLTICKNV